MKNLNRLITTMIHIITLLIVTVIKAKIYIIIMSQEIGHINLIFGKEIQDIEIYLIIYFI